MAVEARPLLRRVSQRTVFVIVGLFLVSIIVLAHQLGASDYIPTFYQPSPPAEPKPTPESDDDGKPKPHGPWEPPKVDPIIHGVHASDAANAEPLYPLVPFPITPQVAPPANESHAPWLAAVICAPWDASRRMMIRASWMRMYQDVPFDGRFVISNPGPDWMETIRMENRTFGDMIVLDALQEDDFTANTIKTLSFYRWLLEKSPKKYEYVSKMDTDLWLNARGFWDRFLFPRLSGEADSLKATVNKTVFGQLYYSPPHKVVFPHGSMYTVTWDMVQLLADLQDEHHVLAGEDLAVAVLMLKAQEKATVVNFKGSEKFDFDERDTRPDEDTAWAPSTTIPTAAEHALYGDDVIAVHQLKSDELWLKVAACFDEQGIKDMPAEKPAKVEEPEPEPTTEEDKKAQEAKAKEKAGKAMKYNRSRFDAIPEEYWEYEDETWLCNGIWKTEPEVDRNPDV